MPINDDLRHRIEIAMQNQLVMVRKLTAIATIEPSFEGGNKNQIGIVYDKDDTRLDTMRLMQAFPVKDLPNAHIKLNKLYEKSENSKADPELISQLKTIEDEIKKSEKFIQKASLYIVKMLPQLVKVPFGEEAKKDWALSEFMSRLCANELSLEQKPAIAVEGMKARLKALENEMGDNKSEDIQEHIKALDNANAERNKRKSIITINPSREDVRKELIKVATLLYKKASELKFDAKKLAAIESATKAPPPSASKADPFAGLSTAIAKPHNQFVCAIVKAVNEYSQGKAKPSSILQGIEGVDKPLIHSIVEVAMKAAMQPKPAVAAEAGVAAAPARLSGRMSSTAALMAKGLATAPLQPLPDLKAPMPHVASAINQPASIAPAPTQQPANPESVVVAPPPGIGVKLG